MFSHYSDASRGFPGRGFPYSVSIFAENALRRTPGSTNNTSAPFSFRMRATERSRPDSPASSASYDESSRGQIDPTIRSTLHARMDLGGFMNTLSLVIPGLPCAQRIPVFCFVNVPG